MKLSSFSFKTIALDLGFINDAGFTSVKGTNTYLDTILINNDSNNN